MSSTGSTFAGFPVSRLMQFALVGGAAAALQSGLLWLFVDIGGLYYLLGSVIAIEITIVTQYVVNNAWTFADRANQGDAFLGGLLRTNVVRGSAIPLQTALLYVFVTWGGLGYLLANLCAIVPSGVYRYVLDAKWTWQSVSPEEN
ncbi:GtrA family protein [Halobacteriales archaeon QH_7_66_36]|nr:MAG: GtrA family protein [Halobacteriales archaeon QH_7_66_36]